MFAAVSTLSQDVRATPWQLWRRTSKRRDEWVLLESGGVFNFLARPNANQTLGDLLELHQIHMGLTGEAYWQFITSSNGRRVDGLQLHYPHWVDEPTIQEGRLVDWKVTIPGYPQTRIPATDMLIPRYPHPVEPLMGASPVQAFALSYSLDLYMKAYGAGLVANRARPDVVVSSDQELTNEQADAIRTRWKERYRVPGEVAVLGKGAKVQTLSFSMQDLAFMQLSGLNREQILAIYKVPASKLGISEQGASRANAETFDHSYNKNALLPQLRRIEDTINQGVLPRIAEQYNYRRDELWFEFISPVKKDEAMELAKATAGLKAGTWSVDEHREATGQERLEGEAGQVYFIPSNVRVVKLPVLAIEKSGQDQQQETPPPEPPQDPNRGALLELIRTTVQQSLQGQYQEQERERRHRLLTGKVRALLSREQKLLLQRFDSGGNLEGVELEIQALWESEGLRYAAWEKRRAAIEGKTRSEVVREYDQFKGQLARELATLNLDSYKESDTDGQV